MTSIKPFQLEDLFNINPVNLDPLTENFNISFYSQYLNTWPNLFYKSIESTALPQDEVISGYMMAKTEGSLFKNELHTHITAVTINQNYRRINLASKLCLQLEKISEVQLTLFIDLFVKVTNELGRKLYEKLGYSIYRRVIGYYGKSMPLDRNLVNDDIDAFDMRKNLPLDKDKKTIRDHGENVYVLPNEIVFL
ncbi:naa20 [Candida jiufengensis]|uniref:naa20 n=1 Tax=Candida jiufengensis TaxID=497108 RepID=UPI0022258A46|nr:naa20 [Candida jiufengensis]KAI5951318.1 naa20 [Candida jiufengensis]